MRLKILDSGYSLGTKALFAMIHLASRQPLPDAAKLVFYRADFYGGPMKELTHAAMRGPSAWSVGDRELMAAFVSQTNECAFCIGAHTATAVGAYHDRERVAAVLSDLETAPQVSIGCPPERAHRRCRLITCAAWANSRSTGPNA